MNQAAGCDGSPYRSWAERIVFMNSLKGWAHFAGITRNHTTESPALYSAEEFQRVINRERACADRSGECFSVVVFETLTQHNSSVDVATLAQVIHRRVRLTDAVGWFAHDRLGVLLHGANASSASKVAEDIRHSASPKISPGQYTILTYPSDLAWSMESNDQSPVRPSKVMKTTRDPFTTKVIQKRSSPGSKVSCDSICPKPAESLEPYLARRLPFWKRALDILGALCGLIVLSPLFLAVALIIKSVSPGPAFFRQERVGYLGKPFILWKFRTMKVRADCEDHKNHMSDLINNGKPMTKLDDCNPQIIPLFGRLLRKSCIDELPQLINVLRGEMSLVGPRPCLPYEFQEYLLWHKRRVFTVPGMTGLWQVSGKNHITFTEMVRSDIAYERQSSLWLDLLIVCKTLNVITSQMIEKSLIKGQNANETYV